MSWSLGQKRNIANENQLYAWQNDGSEHLYTFPSHVFPYNAIDGNGGLYSDWFQSNGAKGKEPPPKVKQVMENYRKAFGVPEDEQIRLGKEIWAIASDEVFTDWRDRTCGGGGLRPIFKNNMGNVPGPNVQQPGCKTPAISRTMTFFYKS